MPGAALRPVLFAVALFVSAALLFAVQPMAGKVLLPLAGGTPAVWNTCLVFFQAVLLLGYLYAHKLTALPPRRQVVWHLAVVLLGLLAYLSFRPNPDWIPEDQDYPVFGLVGFLAVLVGAPFLVLSATAPVLQRWFAATGHAAAKDPYFLYAASNAGSLAGLLGYPFLIEPALPLKDQERGWLIGYAAFFWLAVLCGLAVRWAAVSREAQPSAPASALGCASRLTAARVLKWIALAALPSSLLLSVTTHLTTDVAPVPLLWVVPLALYLLSFVFAFARWPNAARLTVGRLVPMTLVFLAVALLTGATEPLPLATGVHLLAFFAAALLCHGELAHARPAREHLTAFYLALSAGGVLGGLFNALVAPVVFSRLGLVEYPLAVVLTGLIRPARSGSLESLRFGLRDALYLLAFAIFAVALAAGTPVLFDRIALPDELLDRIVRGALAFGLPAVVAFGLAWNPLRFAGCLAILMLAGLLTPGPHGTTLLIERNFFGTLRVTRSPDGKFTRLVHGTTQHGQQKTDTVGPPEPLMYYHRRGPVGRLFATLPAERQRRVAAVGLGCGAMAAYARPGQAWTFYEIDPGVVRIARDPAYFTFLDHCAGELRVELGDARRQLARAPDGSFDLIVLDAFSSDAIPVHLLTREAFALYVRKLAPDGVLAFHLSNRYLNLPPMVARVAGEQGFTMKLDEDHPTDTEKADGKFPSVWAVAFRRVDDVGGVAKDPHWHAVTPPPGPVWRDDYANLLAVWKKDEQ